MCQSFSQLIYRHPSELPGQRIKLRLGFCVERLRTFAVTALQMKDRDSGLNQPLNRKFLLSMRMVPDFFPGFMTFEETPRVEEINAFLEKVSRTIR